MIKSFARFVALLASEFAALSLAMAASAPQQLPQITQAIDPSLRTTLSGNTSRYITSGTSLGALASDEPLDHMLLQLKRSPASEAALEQFIDELHDPNSPNFHQWLTAEEFGALYGPDPSDIATVTSWLESNGFVVNQIFPSGMTIDFSGTAGQVDSAFSASMQNYSTDGRNYISNAVDPSIPRALTPVVVGVISLNNYFLRAQMHRRALPPVLPAPQVRTPVLTTMAQFAPLPEFTFPNGSATEYAVGPGDFNKIYNTGPAWTAGIRGAGQSVTVIERSTIKAADWTTFRNAFGISSPAYQGTFTQVLAGGAGCTLPGAVQGDEPEAALDAEWAGVADPDANIVLAACASTHTSDGIDLAVQGVLNSASPPAIASLSYGQCESSLGATANAAYVSNWQQAVTEHMTVFLSSGDQGAAGCDANINSPPMNGPFGWASQGTAVSGLASTPYNVAVGGTDFSDLLDGNTSTYWSTSNNATTGTSALSYAPEIPWDGTCASGALVPFTGLTAVAFCNSNTNFVKLAAAGGGPSNFSAKPSWQTGVPGIPADGKRGLPDVSLFAANGFLGHSLVYCMSDTTNLEGTACDYTLAIDAANNTAGGTSFAAPSLAGIQALVNQSSGQSWGNMNTKYYALAATEYGNSTTLANCNSRKGNAIGSACIFNDITTGDIAVPCNGGSPSCFITAGQANSRACATSGVVSSTRTCGVLSAANPGSATPAYAATSGWDFATGLGSLNITNLVAAMTAPSKLKFTTGPANGVVNATLGAIVVSVETPAGLVIPQNTTAVTLAFSNNPPSATLAGTLTVNAIDGVATFGNISVNKAGTGYTLHATSGSLAADTSSGFNIAKASQTISFPTVSAQTYSPSGTFSVAATASSGLTVMFGSTTSTVCTVSGTTVTIHTAGTCTITADQAGDGNYNAATQASQGIAIGKANQTISFPTVSAQTYSPSGTFSIAATATSGLTVMFGSTTSTVCTVSGATVTIHTAGTCTITANQAGDSNYNAATQASQGIAIGKANQTIIFPTVSAQTYSPSGTFSVAATATSGLAVTFGSITSTVCTVAGTTVTMHTAGTCTITANQAGDGNYNAATQASQGIAIGKANQTISFPTVSAQTYSPSGTFSVAATATSGLTVTFGSTTSTVCTVAGTTVTIHTAGTCVITADQAGDGNYNAATQASQGIAIDMANQMVMFTSTAPSNAAVGGTYQATADATSGLTVVLTIDSLAASVCSVDNGGVVTFAAVGTCIIDANQPGNGNYNAASQQQQSFSVAIGAGTKLAFTTQPADVLVGVVQGVAVSVEDASDDVVTSDNTTQVSLSINLCGNATLATVQVVNGVAQFPDVRLYTLTTGLQLHALSDSALSDDSNLFAVNANGDFLFANGFESCTP